MKTISFNFYLKKEKKVTRTSTKKNTNCYKNKFSHAR